MELIVKSNGEKMFDVAGVSGNIARSGGAAFDQAEVRAGPTLGDGLYLVVSGPAAGEGRSTRLRPDLNDPSPEYRRIELVIEPGCDHPRGKGRYERSMPLSGLTGTRGIELVGSNRTLRIDLMSS